MVTTNPGIYFRELMPHYARAAKICEVVYDHIDRLYKPMHDQGSLVSSIVTLGGDEGIIKCRCLLGYYKPTFLSHEEQAMAIEEFNDLLKTNAIHPHNYTASEVSDAEHFYSSTIITMVPLLGLLLNPVGTWTWDFIKPSVTTIYSSGKETIFGEQKIVEFPREFYQGTRSDVDQLFGPDLAGHNYGFSVVYQNTPWFYIETVWDWME